MIYYFDCDLTEMQYCNIFRYNWRLNQETLHAISHASTLNTRENVMKSITYLHEVVSMV